MDFKKRRMVGTMKKKVITIVSVLLIIIGALFIYYKIDSVKETKEEMLENSEYVMNNISNSEKLKGYLRSEDGTELSNQQILDFLFNTQLYRANFIKDKEKQFYTYSMNVNYLNTNEGSITIQFHALNGEVITNTFQYIDNGRERYFVADQIKKRKIEKEKIPVAMDLANGTVIGYDGQNMEDIENIENLPYAYVQDKDKNVFLLVNKEIKEDLKIILEDTLSKAKNSLKSRNPQYDMKWDKEHKEFSVYCSKTEEVNILEITLLSCSSLLQTLDGNGDWHLTIKFYDFQTKELLKTEVVR